jgi:hypothetical protein
MYWFDTSEDDPVEKGSNLDTHLSEEMLEEYCFNRLPEEATAALEDHLLVCVHCQAAVQDLDEYILLMKLATAELRRATETLVPKPELVGVPARDSGASLATARAAERDGRPVSDPRRSSRLPATAARWQPFHPVANKTRMIARTAWAAGLGLACAAGLLLFKTAPAQSAAAVPLVAFRGGEDLSGVHAPAATPLDLQADIADLPGADLPGADLPGADPPGANAYRLEVVDVAGQPIWNQTIPASRGALSAHLPKGLRAGVYWVRLYSRSGDLLREFSLRLDDPARHR